MDQTDLIIGIGGAAGDGVASAGNTLALSMARLGLGVYAYNSYQSVIRGGHSYLRMRISAKKPLNQGDQVDVLIALNQDTMDRHLQELKPGGIALYNSAKVKPSYDAPKGVQLCALPVPELTDGHIKEFETSQMSAGMAKLKPGHSKEDEKEIKDRIAKQLITIKGVIQNTVTVGAVTQLIGLEFSGLESVFQHTFAKKPQVVKVNVEASKAGFEHAKKQFKPLAKQLKKTNQKWALMTGNELFAMGAAFGGCRFYCAYPMSPATHILEWFAGHGKELGICVRQVEDEISVINMSIGAGHMGVRSMCATSGGGFALMTEAIGMSGMIESPVVAINVMRAGPSTGVPTKTEQADLNQAFGASQGDFPRVIIAPLSMPDCFATPPLAFNVAERFQCPVIILGDLLMCEGNETVEESFLDVEFPLDRGELITEANGNGNGSGEPYLRYKDTPSGISPRAIPGLPGHLYVSGTDEHDEDGVLISDVYTDPIRRKKMVDKRTRKFEGIIKYLPAPKLEGPAKADVTLLTWGSSWGVCREAIDMLAAQGVSANLLAIKYLMPFHVKEVSEILGKAKKVVIVEMNQSGQFARHLRAETGIVPNGHVRKFDGEPFEPLHVVNGVKQVLAGKEVVEVVSTEPGWQTEHPTGTSGDWKGRMIPAGVGMAVGSRGHGH